MSCGQARNITKTALLVHEDDHYYAVLDVDTLSPLSLRHHLGLQHHVCVFDVLA